MGNSYVFQINKEPCVNQRSNGGRWNVLAIIHEQPDPKHYATQTHGRGRPPLMWDDGARRNAVRPSTSSIARQMGQELVELRADLNEVNSELGGITHLRAEIAELTAAPMWAEIVKFQRHQCGVLLDRRSGSKRLMYTSILANPPFPEILRVEKLLHYQEMKMFNLVC